MAKGLTLMSFWTAVYASICVAVVCFCSSNRLDFIRERTNILTFVHGYPITDMTTFGDVDLMM